MGRVWTRGLWLVGLLGLAAGCTNHLALRQAELSAWVGQPEVDLVAAMGAPARTYETGGMKFLTYDDRRIEVIPGSPGFGPGPYFGADPYWYGGGFPPTATTLVCDTTFTVAKGVVRAFSLRGNACG